MSKPDAFLTGEAIVGCIYQGAGRPLNWDETKEAVQHPTEKLTRAQLVDVIAYLGAQLVGSRASVDKDAALAMQQIQSIVREYEQRAEVAA